MASDITYHRLKYSALLWVALGFCIFAVVAAYSSRMTNDFPGYDDGRGKDRKATADKAAKAEDALLHPVDKDGHSTAVWVDQDKGFIQIPIDEAMTHEVADLKNVTVGEGAAIPGTTPAPAPAPTATNAAPAATAHPANVINMIGIGPKINPMPSSTPAKPKHKKPAPASPTPPTTMNGGNAPVFNTRHVATTVVVREGENIVVIGRLIPSTTATP